MPIDTERVVNFNDKDVRICDIPEAYYRHLFGMGHEGVHPERLRPEARVSASRMEPPLEYWPHEITDCPYNAPEDKFVWIENGGTLVCPGCGLDGT